MDLQSGRTIGSEAGTEQGACAEAAGAPRGAPDFVFDSKGPLSRLTDAEILEGLRRFVRSREGRRFSIHDFGDWAGRPCSKVTVVKRFGSWRDALRRIGVAGGRDRRHSPEHLVEMLESAWRKIGRRPGAKLLERTVRIRAESYIRHWGSLRAACEAIDAFHRGLITREELLRGSPRRATARVRVRPSCRYAVLRRDGFRCQLCGRGAASTPPVELEIDHIVPVAKGGGGEESNLRVLCRECNRGRGAGGDLVE